MSLPDDLYYVSYEHCNNPLVFYVEKNAIKEARRLKNRGHKQVRIMWAKVGTWMEVRGWA